MKIKNVSSGLVIAMFLFFFISCKKSENAENTDNGSLDNIQILLDLSNKIFEQDQDKSLQYALSAIQLSKRNKDYASEAKSLKVAGDLFYKQNLPRKALPYYNSALQIFYKQYNTAMVNLTCLKIGDSYYKLNLIDSSLLYYNLALKSYQESGDHLATANVFLKIGNIYWVTNNYDKSLEFYLYSLQIYEDLKYSKGLARLYINIGLVYYITEYYDKSLEYYIKSEKILSANNDLDALAELYLRMGDSYTKKNMNSKAINFYDNSLKIHDRTSNNLKKAWVYQAKSQALHNLGRLTEAIELINKALEISRNYDDKWFKSSLYSNLAEYLIDKGAYKDALLNLNKGSELAKDLNILILLKDNYLGYSRYYMGLGDYKQSLDYYKLYHQINDSIQNKERTERIMQLQTRFESDRNKKELRLKEREIIENKAKLKKQTLQLYLFASGILTILILSIALFRQYKVLEKKGKKIERINEELDQRVKERTSALRLTQFSIDHASDPIYWLNPSGNYFFANKSGSEKLGYTNEELENLSITDVIPNFSSDDWKQFWEIIKLDKSLTLETYHRKHSGKIFPVEIILNYVSHEGNEFAFAYVRDISERKLREENLKKAKEKAEEADKLKSAFLANMSHEIRTPMNAIIGFSDLLVNEEYSEEEKKEFGNLIKNSGTTLLKLIDDIIDISILESGHLKLSKSSVNINSHLKEIAMFFQEDKERLKKINLEISLNLPPDSDSVMIETDPVRFRQVINNLVANALKFTDSGVIEIGYAFGNDAVLYFYVKDSGIGIKPEKISFIFERFNKLDDDRRVYAGTGLGLTISKKIVEELGGFMYVESEYGKGSKFSFTLPYYHLDEYKKEESLDLSKGIMHDWRNRKILVVEDVDSNYFFIKTVIEKTKAQIAWAKSGKQAIDLCNHILPDLILMDIQLPELNGYDATKVIRERYPEIPIIAQSAYAFAGEKDKIIDSGCNEYISKPIKPKVLLETINKYFI